MEAEPTSPFPLGKGETASDDTAYADLSATTIAGRSSVQDIGGGLFFRNKNTDLLTAIQVRNVFNGLDGFSRRNRFRYNTPSFHGLMIATSFAADNKNDIF